MHKSINKAQLYEYLCMLGNCYAKGDFSDLYPYLADDCVWESQWRLTPETGKESVISYFEKKGEILRESGSFPKWMVVEFIDNMNPIEDVKLMGQHKEEHATVALYYEAGKLALFMSQNLDDRRNAMILDLTLNEKGLIRRIDLCMPELFKFVKYEENVKF